MEQQVLDLLQATTKPNTDIVRQATESLQNLYSNADFPFALLSVASHTHVQVSFRKAALTTLKNYVTSTWSPTPEDPFYGATPLNEEAKTRIREQVFALCTNDSIDSSNDNNIQALAAGIASRIAHTDFPDTWPTLFPTLISILTGTTNDAQVLGALRVMSQLIDSGFTEEQFFAVARDLVNALQNVATNSSRKPRIRAMAMSVFRECFDMLEMIMEDHKVAVKQFLDESLKQ